jgi:hypothetical protein
MKSMKEEVSADKVFSVGIYKLINDREHQYRSQMIKRGIHATSLRKEAKKSKNKSRITKKNKITSK